MEKNKIVKLIDGLEDKKLEQLYNYIKRLNRKKNSTQIKKKVDRSNIDKTTTKYKLLLKYVNGILKNIGKEEIDDLTKFKDIDRLDIIKEINLKLLDSMAPTLFKHFDKKGVGYYRKTQGKALNCLRGLCKELGLVLLKRQHNRQVKCIFKSHMLYSII